MAATSFGRNPTSIRQQCGRSSEIFCILLLPPIVSRSFADAAALCQRTAVAQGFVALQTLKGALRSSTGLPEDEPSSSPRRRRRGPHAVSSQFGTNVVQHQQRNGNGSPPLRIGAKLSSSREAASPAMPDRPRPLAGEGMNERTQGRKGEGLCHWVSQQGPHPTETAATESLPSPAGGRGRT
jgi:hypothetical protein